MSDSEAQPTPADGPLTPPPAPPAPVPPAPAAPAAPPYATPASTYGAPPAYAAPPAGPASGYGAPPVYGAAPVYGSAPGYGAYAAAKTNTLAVVSLISSIAGWVLIPIIASIVGVVTGHIALGQIKRTGEGGRGLALAGTIVGWVGLGFAILGIIILLAMIPWFVMNVREFSNA